MEQTIEKAVESVKKIFEGYSFNDQAYMFDRVAGRMLNEMDECLLLEYGITDIDK